MYQPSGLLPTPASFVNDAAASSSYFSGIPAALSTLPTVSDTIHVSQTTTSTDSDPTSSMVAALYSTSSAVLSPEKGPQHGDENNGECKLLGPFALIIQAALGGLALLSLVYKRWRERPQRPLKIWAFDASKQVFGSVLLHVANLLMSMLSAGQLTVSPSVTKGYQPNPCSFYLLNLAIDVRISHGLLSC